VYFWEQENKKRLPMRVEKYRLIPFLTIAKDTSPDEKKSLYICL